MMLQVMKKTRGLATEDNTLLENSAEIKWNQVNETMSHKRQPHS